MTTPTTPSPSSTPSPRNTGRRAVFVLFGFGFLMVGALWLYWELYTRPFRPLQNAIAAAYPGCRPSVVGGRHKSHLPGSPRILRLVIHMPGNDFNPVVEPAKSEERALNLARLAAEKLPLSTYDSLEIHLVQRIPEQKQRHWSVSRPTAEWLKEISPSS